MVTNYKRLSVSQVDKKQTLNGKTIRDMDTNGHINDCLFHGKVVGFYAIKLARSVSYRYRYQDKLGKRRTYTFGSYPSMSFTDALTEAKRLEANKIDPLADKDKSKRDAIEGKRQSELRTLGGYLNGLYQAHQLKKRSGKETLAMIRKNFDDWLDRDMVTLTKADIKQWQSRRETEIKFATIQRAYGALKTMLNKAVDDELLESNPLPRKSPLEKPHFEEVDSALIRKRERRVLEQSEVHALFDGLQAYADDLRRQRANTIKRGRKSLESFENVLYPHWIIPFVYCAYFTGLRTGDLFTLTWEELNLSFKRLNKIPSKTRHHSDPIEVTLSLPYSLVEIMSEWHKQSGSPNSGLVFPNDKGVQFDKGAHKKGWANVKRFSGLDEELVFYTLRHNFISQLVMSGLPLFTVARLAGHKSVKMIEQTYGDLSPSHTANALDVLTPKVEANHAKRE